MSYDGRLSQRGGKVTRRSFLGMLGAGVAGAALASCAPVPPAGGPHGSRTIALVYQDWWTEWFPGMAQQMLDQFHAGNPDIHVFFTPDPENVEDQMLRDMEAGTAPDVLAGCCDSLPVWAQKGYLLDLRPYVAADLDRATANDWDKAHYEALFLPDGRQFALPRTCSALVLYFNKDLFDQSHVAYPDETWTHDDYLQAMKRLTRLPAATTGGRGQWGSTMDIAWERLQVHVNGWGGHFVDPKDPRRSQMVSPQTLAALRWLRTSMWEDRCLATSLDVQNLTASQAFVEGRVAMAEDCSWSLKQILEGAAFRVGVASFPAGPARRVTLDSTDGFAIYAGTRHPEAAWQFLKFLISREYGRAMATEHLLQPARASLVGEWAQMVREQYPAKASDLDLAAFTDPFTQGYSVVPETFATMEKPRKLARAAWQQIFTLGRAPVESVYELTAQIEGAQIEG